ncbi:hypothetical protein MJO29_010645 [Puccinia striiformis f. sp. tritici]|uniref:hypothetical protein n=1 Tax=Puccinia striiformis f. sp. tritici TaxID=168172 RepID=UPI002007629F|nr:hypothetical protein Pst134EA_019723 [Puccinia striiformis f. sp. tritici]KAH9459579.1 hypothetical protein Pst134EA_019723 [Puccinia striiformis f. sp. tritici]KAI7948980.1 hypothetical protein MJO29_010645 [Puccinia striiformis f. sp. tritici]
MNFSRLEALILIISLFGLRGAHSLRPRALPAPQTESTGTPSDSNPTLDTVPNSRPASNTRPVSNSNTVPKSTPNTLSTGNTDTNPNSAPTTVSDPTTNPTGDPEHPGWRYLNGFPWWQQDPTQQDHARFHCYLSMASYGDYATLCPNTFTKGFTVLEEFNTPTGQGGFTALIPEMEKVVIVFRGFENYQALNWRQASIEDLIGNCRGCKAAAGVKKLYLSAKAATNNWEIATKKVAETGLKFSVTGHGIGGSVAALAAMDLGQTGLVHYSHNQGMPRSLNREAVLRYDDLFQVLAGQSLVAENDFMVQTIPKIPYYHVGSKVKISGDMQQWLTNCYGNNENVTCTGLGNNYAIHDHYFTPKGQCGSANKGW